MARRSSKARKHPRSRPQGILEITSRGFGFVKTAEGEYFIPASKMYGAFPGDLVEVGRISSNRGRYQKPGGISSRKPTGRVAKIISRANERIIGRYEIAEPFGVVIPSDTRIPYDIFTLRKDSPDVEEGSLVEVELIEYPSRNSAATGRVTRVIGKGDDSNLEIDLIIAQHKLETEFNDQALEEASACTLDIGGALADGYRDLRDRFIFTIDPVDARDYDDALSVELDGDRIHLGVHIADVSGYVPFDSALDYDARRRGCSVYLVDRVIPMLPEQLSNELCSLVPDQDRLAVSVDVVLRASDAVVEKVDIFPSVIRSKARLSYDQAQAIIDANEDAMVAAFRAKEAPFGANELTDSMVGEVAHRIRQANELAKKLYKKRYTAGCMEFDRVEARAILDPAGRPTGIKYRRRTEATGLIEECMILANHLVAQWLTDRSMPCIYRTHAAPGRDSLFSLYEILQEFDAYKTLDKTLFVAGNPHVLQELLDAPVDEQTHELVSMLLLRSMKQAIYSTTETGHYGLALEDYCHFTSPIRRYPDLFVHRMVKEALRSKSETFEAEKNSSAWIAEHSSETERIAAKAELQSQLVKLIEYLQDFIGQNFETIIYSVSTFGVVLRMENTVQGFLPIEELGDEYFSYNPERGVLTGSDTGRTYRIGQKLNVMLAEADWRSRQVLFKMPPNAL
ncbi:ribonuclease R [Anaerotardibacter muris]|uniref:ribonuclease R n=1 Tax=Anaerotardibacter muris TaxID=2941505 RepID=UPI002041088A|nr:ribonuclease R [Anaerotardibacter muris]